MENMNSPTRRLALPTQTHAGLSALRRCRTSESLRALKQAGRLAVCLLLVCQGPVFSPAVLAQRTARSLPRQLPQQPKVASETPQISTGALIDEMLQRSPQSFGPSAVMATPARGTRSAPGVSADGGANLVAPPTDPQAPALNSTFDAINFNDDSVLTGFFHIPPDPAGAAGASHVVNVGNTHIEWYTKTGTRQNRQRLGADGSGSATGSFFASQVPLTGTFDPKVIYDQYAGRFVVISMERTELASGAAANTSRVFVAVSDDSDPNGTWFYLTLPTEELIGANQSWADFPGLAVDSEAVYFTTNMFAHNNQPNAGVFQGQRLWIIAKAPFYTGGTPTFTRYNPTALAAGTDGGAIATTMQPTQMYGDTPGGVGTYLLAYGGINDGTSLYVQVIRVDSPLSSPTFTERFSLWGTIAANDNIALALPSAPQPGTTRTIATNDRRFSQNGVLRNGMIYCAAPTRPPTGTDANQTTVHYFVIDPAVIDSTVADPPPTDQGNVGGEDIAAATHTFFPSVAVDSAGNLAIGFAASGSNLFPGSYYTGRLAAAPPGTTQGAGGLRAGRDFYIRDFTTSTTVASRWGDYSGIWLDPANETTFWVYNESALPRGTILTGLPEEDGRWGTAWGSFSLGAPATVPLGAVIISEFRLRGPLGATDEFIELYNNTDAAITVSDVNPPATGPSGWAIVSADAPTTAKAIVPSGATIPARGHYLVANSGGYSLTNYPSGNNTLVTTTATPDRTYTTNIPDDRGIALFRSANPTNFTVADQLDAVGPASEAVATFREGTGLPDIGTSNLQYSWVRRLPGGCTGSNPGYVNHNCTDATTVQNTPPPTSGNSQDTGNNVVDFIFVETGGALLAGPNQRLGAPGPENLTSPVVRGNPNGSGTINPSLVDTNAASSAPPNRVRDLTDDPSEPNDTFGKIDIRRRFTNNTGQNVTRMRFRIMDISTFPNPAGVADLRPLTSTDVLVNLTNGGTSSVRGTTLETPPAQPNGGGFNSTLSTQAGIVQLAQPLVPGQAVNIRFLFGVQANGKFRVFVNVEALP